jgi:ubiquitin-protein ligase
MLSVLLWLPASDYPFGVFCHYVVCSSAIDSFWIPIWYLLTIVLSVLLWLTASDYPCGIFWPLCCLSCDWQLLITHLVSFGYCVVCPSAIDSFWLPIWYLVAILLSVLRLIASDYPFGIFWPLCCLSFCDWQVLITHLVFFGHYVVCPSVIYSFWLPMWYLLAIVLSVLRLTASDYPFGMVWPLCCLSFCDWQLLITHLLSCGHCVVCPSVIDSFWLAIWYLVSIVLSVLLWLTASDYPFGILWPLCCLSFCDWQLLITHLVSCSHCVVCPANDSFWLPIWYLLAIMLSVLLWLTASDYLFGIFWPLCCLSFCDWQLLITHLVYCGHCVVCPVIDSFWLPIWYFVSIVLSVLLWLTASDYPFGIFKLFLSC